jgi:cobalt-precorrin-7 (C5)-methyltransferase
MKHKIIVAGIGPGNEAYIVPKALQAIKSAKVLVGGRRALAQFAHTGQKTMAVTADIKGVMAFMASQLTEHDVVVMVSGDPGYYSLLDALRREFPPESLQVIPGISAMQYAFASLALPWHDAQWVSFHGRVPAADAINYAPGKIMGMLTDGKYNSHTIPELLLKNGWPADTSLYICSRLSYPDEEIVTTTLGNAGTIAVQGHCILVVKARN